jgi:methyl coenzyme M reductase subunit C
MVHANLRRGRPMVRLCWISKSVCQVRSRARLHCLSPDVRHVTTSLCDGTHQARRDRTTGHLMDVIGGHDMCLSGVVEVGEPTVLQPAPADQVSGLVEDLGHAMELGESRTGLVTES